MVGVIVPLFSIWMGYAIAMLIGKYTGGVYSADFFGKRTAFLMNTIPFIPEIVLAVMLPFWLTYWAIRGVAAWTKHIDEEWKKLKEM